MVSARSPGESRDGSNAAEWPPVEYESLPWERSYEPGQASRAEMRAHSGPYRAAVVPEIADRDLRLPAVVAAGASDAAAELSRFDAELGSEIAPFGAVLLRSEAAASSQIENLTASARAIAEAELGVTSRRNADLIVANTRTMEAAVALSGQLDADAILTMHRALMEQGAPRIAGRWRSEQVWIGGGSIGPHQAVFVPPHDSRVVAGIADLVRFIDREDLPALPHVAVAHAQFETIHPFPDGNGRTGRSLVHAMLRNKALTRNVTVPVSAGLLTDTRRYFDALGAYRVGDPSQIVDRFSSAVFAALDNGRHLVSALRDLRESWDDRVQARSDSAAWRVADFLLRRPVVNAALIADELGIDRPNVYRQIAPLEDAGVLVEFTDQKRNRVWRSPEVLAAIDDFARRAGKRTGT